MSALHSKAPLIAPKKWEIKLFPLHFSFHLHSFTAHQRESRQPDTQQTIPLSDPAGAEARQKACFPQPFTLFDRWLLLI